MPNLNMAFCCASCVGLLLNLSGWKCRNIWCLWSCICHTLFVMILLCCVMIYSILLYTYVLVTFLYTFTLLSYYSISYSLLTLTAFTLYFIYKSTLHLNKQLGSPLLFLRSLIVKIRIGISFFSTEIPDEPPCYVRPVLLLRLNCLDFLGDQCHEYSILCTL